MSIASFTMEVPSNLEPGGKTDYLKMKIMYEKFWTECHFGQSAIKCSLFQVDTKYAISIN
jgi:hypothetical protein